MADLFTKNVKGNRMNLFTTYTKEETKFLLEIGNKSFPSKKNNFFTGIDTSKLSHFKRKTVEKKDTIENFEFIFIQSGRIAVVKNKQIIKILKKNECFGFLNTFLHEQYNLIALEKSEIILFGLGENIDIYKKIMECIAKDIKDKLII